MLDLLSTFINTDLASFPDTKAVDSSGGAATDGTEFIANMINDSMWGWQQALLNFTFQSPNGLVESVSNSQIIKAMQRFTIPGSILAVAWNDDPITLGIRAILMTGQGILRANYSDLDDIVYVGDANNGSASAFYHADDSAGTIPNISGAYLILPDLRGRVIRGLDLGGTIDPDGASRDLGSGQGSAMWGHFHTLESYGSGGATNRLAPVATGAAPYFDQSPGSRVSGAIDDGINGTPSVSSESRMTNVALNYMIAY